MRIKRSGSKTSYDNLWNYKWKSKLPVDRSHWCLQRRQIFCVKTIVELFLPEIMMFLSSLVNYENKIKHTKFTSPVHNTIPSVVTSIAHWSRRDSGFRLYYRSAMHATDPKHFPKRFSNIKFMLVKMNSAETLAFD